MLANSLQRKAIEDFYGAPPGDTFTAEHATLALSVRDYVRAVSEIAGEAGQPVSAFAARVVSARLINRPDFQKYIEDWNSGRFSRGRASSKPRLSANRHFVLVLLDLIKMEADPDVPRNSVFHLG